MTWSYIFSLLACTFIVHKLDDWFIFVNKYLHFNVVMVSRLAKISCQPVFVTRYKSCARFCIARDETVAGYGRQLMNKMKTFEGKNSPLPTPLSHKLSRETKTQEKFFFFELIESSDTIKFTIFSSRLSLSAPIPFINVKFSGSRSWRLPSACQ